MGTEIRRSDVQNVSIIDTGGFLMAGGTAVMGTMYTIAIGGGNVVSISNSAGWIVDVANTGGSFAAYQSGTWTVSAAGTNTVNIINSAGWVVTAPTSRYVNILENTASMVLGSVYSMAGSQVMGSINILSTGTDNLFKIWNTAGWIIAGGSLSIINTATKAILDGGSTSIINSAGWIVKAILNAGSTYIINTAGWVINQANTSRTMNAGTALIGSASCIQAGNWKAIVDGGSMNLINTVGLVLGAGTALIGSAGAIQYGIWNVTANCLQQGTWFPSSVIETQYMTSAGMALRPFYANFDVTATNNTVIAASGGKALRVLQYELMAQVAVNAKFESGTGGTAYMSGIKYLGGSGGMVAPFSPMGWFQTQIGSSLNLRLSAATSVGGSVTYLYI